MKKILTLSVLMLIMRAQNVHAQTCCIKQGGDWRQLMLDKKFMEAHLSPLPFMFVPQAGGKMISFTTADSKKANAFFVPSKNPTNKILLIFHEWWGLNDYIKQEAERWQELLGGDIDVYAVDLFDGKVATKPEEAGKLANSMNQKHGEAIIQGLLKTLNNKEIATLGWCFGGSWSFTASVLAGNRAKACVMYYGFPEKDAKRIAMLKTDVLYHYALQDNFIKKDMVKELEKQVKANGHAFEYHEYDAVHAFANPSNPKYDKERAQEAQEISMGFIRNHLGL